MWRNILLKSVVDDVFVVAVVFVATLGCMDVSTWVERAVVSMSRKIIEMIVHDGAGHMCLAVGWYTFLCVRAFKMSCVFVLK